MKNRSLFVPVLVLIAFAAAGCGKTPDVINHETPALSVEFSPFTDAGCPDGDYGIRLCEPSSPLAAFGCDRIEQPPDLFGGLTPAVSMAVCVFEFGRHWDDFDLIDSIERDGYIHTTGGLSPVHTRYVVYEQDGFTLLPTAGDMQSFFAPIDRAEEALSYAMALTGYSAYYGLEVERGMRYLVNTLEDTHVEEVEDGYLVHLYYYRFFGCGPHTTSAVDVLVTRDGTLTELGWEGVFEDPEEDQLCVD